MCGDRCISRFATVSSGHKEVLVTHLRKLTLDEIARRNYTESTTRAYIRVIADFARAFLPSRHTPQRLSRPLQAAEIMIQDA